MEVCRLLDGDCFTLKDLAFLDDAQRAARAMLRSALDGKPPDGVAMLPMAIEWTNGEFGWFRGVDAIRATTRMPSRRKGALQDPVDLHAFRSEMRFAILLAARPSVRRRLAVCVHCGRFFRRLRVRQGKAFCSDAHRSAYHRRGRER
jgi:hypothetical protein